MYGLTTSMILNRICSFCDYPETRNSNKEVLDHLQYLRHMIHEHKRKGKFVLSMVFLREVIICR